MKTITRDSGLGSSQADLDCEYFYDPAGRMEKVEFANGAKMVYTYDNADRPTLIEHKNASNVVKYSIAYAWNTDNTVDQRTETDYTPATTQTHVTSFSYDHRKPGALPTAVASAGKRRGCSVRPLS